MCDCCVPNVDTVCEIYFGFYLLLMLLTVIALLNLCNVRKRSNLPVLIRNNSTKFWIIVGVLALQFTRIIYFSTTFFKDHLTNTHTSSMMCLEEWSIQVPVLLEYINIAIVHDFLLRLYLVIHGMHEPYKKHLAVYTTIVCLWNFLICVTVSSIYCNMIADDANHDVLIMKVVGIFQAAIVMIFNPVIVVIVVHSLYNAAARHPEARVMFIKIVLLGLFSEISVSMRIVLLVRQEEWKQEEPGLFIIFFTMYIFFGEVACQIILLHGIFFFSRKLRVKYLRTNKKPLDDQYYDRNISGSP